MSRFAIVIVGLILLTGCGDDEEANEPSPARDRPAQDQASSQGPSQRELLRDTYENAKDVCGAQPPAATAVELGLSKSASEDAIAEEYSAGYTGPHQGFAFDGCFAGLIGG